VTTRFIRRPLEVHAIQAPEQTLVSIASGEIMTARPGDWIITNPVNGNQWVCEAEHFHRLYVGLVPTMEQ
jgi:hypothetical protein